MSYTIVKGTNLLEFEKEVQKHLKWGWRCQGGISCGINTFYQAMVKKK